MSVLIKGMKMPRNCNECPMLRMPDVQCSYTCRLLDRDDFWKLRNEYCPLVELPEKHGRLIDERIAQRSIGDHMTGLSGRDGRSDWQRVHDGLSGTPTVIEAEGEG